MKSLRHAATGRRTFQRLEDRRLLAAGPYSPPAGDRLSDAVGLDDPAIIGWATAVADYSPGAEVAAAFGDASGALGPVTGRSPSTVSLGRGGSITLQFDRPLRDGLGDDFTVFENSFSDTFLELAYVEVSSDGVNFRRFDSDSRTAEPVSAFGELDSTQISGLAGTFRGGFGTPFDLADLGSADLGSSVDFDPDRVTHVRIVDVVGDGSARDSDGDVIYDPFPTVDSAGFDLDGVGVIHASLSVPQTINFESVNLPAGGFDNNADGGAFDVGSVTLNNDFESTFGSWQGFALSSVSDATTPGFTNQYAAFPGGGAGGSDRYAVAFQSDAADPQFWPTIRRDPGGVGTFESIEVANTTYAALSMRDGDSFAKKFGGPSGNDPDFFTLVVEGLDASGGLIGDVSFDLADFRSDDPVADFIRRGWSRVDVSSIGDAAALRLRFESSDVYDFGINTPTYAAIDNVVLAQPAIAIELPSRRTDESTPIRGRVTRGGRLDQPLVVSIAGGGESVASSVTIAAGQRSAPLVITPVDDDVAGGDAVIALTASADGFAPVRTSLRVIDNDIPGVRFEPGSVSVAEGQAITVTLRRTGVDQSVATEVRLVSDLAGLSFPPTVAFAAGAETVDVVVRATQDEGFGDKMITLNATAGDLTTQIVIAVTEDDGDTFVLRVDPAAVLREADPEPVTATLSRLTDDPVAALTINLAASDPSRVRLPASVTIPAGQAAATFEIRVLDDSVLNPIADVTVTAVAAGLGERTVTIGVLDDEVASLAFATAELLIAEEFGGSVTDFDGTGLLAGGGFANDAGGYPIVSGGLRFENSFTRGDGFSFYAGFAVSDVVDSVTPGFGNQFAAFPGGGAGPDGGVEVGGTYAVAAAFAPVHIEATGRAAFESLRLANTTYAALSMRDGDAFAKQFGGPEGTDPDFFIVTIEGLTDRLDGRVTGSIDVPLADFRFDDPALDYIADSWIDVDLAPLSDRGVPTVLRLSVSSSDVGDFGINTPAAFAIDDVVTTQAEVPQIELVRDVADLQSETAVSLSISGDGASRVTVPAEVRFARGQSRLVVPLGLVNDEMVNAFQPLTLRASIDGGPSSLATITVVDAQGPGILLASESLSGGILDLNEFDPTELTVRLRDAPTGPVVIDPSRNPELLAAGFEASIVGPSAAGGGIEFTSENYATPRTITLRAIKNADFEVGPEVLAPLQLLVSRSPTPAVYAATGRALVVRLVEAALTDLLVTQTDGEIRLSDAAGRVSERLETRLGGPGRKVLSDADEALRVPIDLDASAGVSIDAAGGVDTLTVEVGEGGLAVTPNDVLGQVAGFENIVFNGVTQRLLLDTTLLSGLGALRMSVDATGGAGADPQRRLDAGGPRGQCR